MLAELRDLLAALPSEWQPVCRQEIARLSGEHHRIARVHGLGYKAVADLEAWLAELAPCDRLAVGCALEVQLGTRLEVAA